MSRLLLALCAVWLLASPARADVFAIVPPFFQGTDGRELSESIVKIIHEELKHQGVEALLPAETVKFVPTSKRVACGNEQCAEVYRAAANATAAIVLRIYRGQSGSGPATSFQVDVQPHPGMNFSEGALLADGPSLSDLVLKALHEAQRRYQRGPGPWLNVTGAPEGAAIFVDDAKVGAIPALLLVSTGTHRLRVEAPGFESVTKLVSLATSSATQDEDVTLEPAVVAAAPKKTPEQLPPRERRAWGNVAWVIAGAALCGYGLALFISGSMNLARDGDCHTRDDGVCTSRYEAGRSVNARIGVGAALTAVGAFGIGWGARQLRITPQASTQHAGIVLRGSM